MFLGSLTDFFFPNFIGQIINNMKDGNSDMLNYNLNMWVGTMIFSAACSLIRDTLFGVASERLGASLRRKLFESVIYKDVAFFDENRTGDICKFSKDQLCRLKNQFRHLGCAGWPDELHGSFV